MDQSLKVLNQFHHSYKSGKACMAISIVVIYQLYSERETGLSDDDWDSIMESGTKLWSRWNDLYGRNKTFPAADEMLNMKECKKFIELFGNEPREYCEWSRPSKDIYGKNNNNDSLKNSLINMFRDVEAYVNINKKCVACLIVVPPAFCISVSIFDKNEYQYFDSHGNGKSKYCDYIIFSRYMDVIDKIYNRYKIKELEANSFCSYSAMLYVK